MTVGILRIEMQIYADSLKGKRSVVKSLLDRIRARFNAGAAEVGHLDDHGAAMVGIVCVSNDRSHADAMLQHIATFIETQRLDVEILSIETELISA